MQIPPSSHMIIVIFKRVCRWTAMATRKVSTSDLAFTLLVRFHTLPDRRNSPSFSPSGAIFFWPSAKFEKYGGFVGCTFVIGCGLSCLEVAANSYISVLGSPKYAAARLNFSQGFQGVASFAGPMIASRWFFVGKNATSLDTVQW